MRIGIVKPDFGVRGGFEVVLARLVKELTARGHEIVWRRVKVHTIGTKPFGLEVPEDVWSQSWEAFRYLSMVDAFLNVDIADTDVAITTQPPSFVVDHPAQVSIFYHHLRVYYDLSDVYLAAGFADPKVHSLAQRAIRTVDAQYIDRPSYFLAGSENVRTRLARFHGLTERISVFHAASSFVEAHGMGEPTPGSGPVLCVSRHEFPKRTELFVHAMKYLPDQHAIAVGAGGRLPFVEALDVRLDEAGTNLDALGPGDLWLNRGEFAGPRVGSPSSRLHLIPYASDDELVALYRNALCVVAPAYLEDYGLTAIEAMSFGRPVIVCADGGGLTELVEDGVTGFVVQPTGSAIAEAVRRFVDDPALAMKMGRNGRERVADFTWARAMNEIDEALDQARA